MEKRECSHFRERITDTRCTSTRFLAYDPTHPLFWHDVATYHWRQGHSIVSQEEFRGYRTRRPKRQSLARSAFWKSYKNWWWACKNGCASWSDPRFSRSLPPDTLFWRSNFSPLFLLSVLLIKCSADTFHLQTRLESAVASNSRRTHLDQLGYWGFMSILSSH